MTVTFGGHQLDLGARQLFRDSVEVRLSPKAFELLTFLIDRRPRAVSKTEIHDHLWPGTFVTEANLASLIAELRRALRDNARAPNFIRTVHSFGYSFCGQIDATRSAAETAATACWVVSHGREIPLRDDNVIGRDADVAVRLDFPSVSRRHARIRVADGAATLEDLGSKNGTLLRGAPIDGVTALADLDEVQIGSVKILIRIQAGGELTRTIER